MNFVHTMVDPSVVADTKAMALKTAMEAHREYVLNVSRESYIKLYI